MEPLNCQENCKEKAGSVASEVLLFGPWHRYKVYACHTRFDKVCWFVQDAETVDEETGLPQVIRQEDTFDEAIEGLR